MDDETSLLGEPDSPETQRKRVFFIMECLEAGKPIEALTEKEIKNVEETIRKVQAGIVAAKRSMLTDDDILNVANLNFLSPAPTKSVSNTTNPEDNYDFSSPLRDHSDEFDDLQLDYEESIDGRSTTSEGSRRLEIDTSSEVDDGEIEDERMIADVAEEELEDIMEISRKPMASPELKPQLISFNKAADLQESKAVVVKTESQSQGIKRKSSEEDDKPPGVFRNSQRDSSVPTQLMSGLRLLSTGLTSPVRQDLHEPKIEDDDVIFLSSDSETDTVKPEIPKKRQRIVYDLNSNADEEKGVEADDEDAVNVSRANFSKKLTKENPYLKMRCSRMTVDAKKLGLTYPLGVTFDKPTDTWFITNIPYQLSGSHSDNGESKIMKIYVGKDRKVPKYSDITDSMIENPMAITVYMEGSEIAVLCSDNHKKPWISLVNFRRKDRVSTFCSYRNSDLDFTFPSRGLARTKGGNLLTTDRPHNGPPRLRIFSKRSSGCVKDATFVLKNASIPCFVASSGSTVVVTDLGATQTVMLMKIDDTDWNNVKFDMIKVIKTANVNLRAEEMLNNEYFIYVSGVQIDKNGNIIVADAKNHHFKLFHPTMKFINRISTDFPVPYVSSFHVNQYGECLILSTRETEKVRFAKLTSSNKLEKHIKSGSGGRIGVKNPLSSKRRIVDDDSD
ncbi:unnamed protein product [Caenorhabditis brenneri]